MVTNEDEDGDALSQVHDGGERVSRWSYGSSDCEILMWFERIAGGRLVKLGELRW